MGSNVTADDLYAALLEVRATTRRIDDAMTDLTDFKDDAKDGLSEVKDFIYTPYFIYICVFFGLVLLANTLIVLYCVKSTATGTYHGIKWVKRQITPSSPDEASTSSKAA